MFFLIRLLLITLYISEINNFIFKKNRQGINQNIEQTGKHVTFQAERKENFPTLLILTQNDTNRENPIPTTENRRLKVIPIKRHIHDKDIPELVLKSTKTVIAIPVHEIKQKWPVVEFLSKSDEFQDNPQYFDEIDKKPFPFFHDIDNESTTIELPPKIVLNYDINKQNNKSKNKTVGLRSLLARERSPDKGQCVCENTGKSTTTKCPTTKECTRTTISISMMPFYVPYDMYNIPKVISGGFSPVFPPVFSPNYHPKGYSPNIFSFFSTVSPMEFSSKTTAITKITSLSSTFSVPMGFPMGYPVAIPANFPMSFPGLLPAACPSGILHSYYPPDINKKHKKKPSQTKLDEYNDVSMENNYDYNDNDNTNFVKEKHDQIHTNYIHKGDLIIDIEYEEKQSKKKQNCVPAFRDKLEDLMKENCNHLKPYYGETIIKDYYCSSALRMKVRIIFFCINHIILNKLLRY